MCVCIRQRGIGIWPGTAGYIKVSSNPSLMKSLCGQGAVEVLRAVFVFPKQDFLHIKVMERSDITAL